MEGNTNILFVLSKSTGYIALKSFLESNDNILTSVLLLDDRDNIRSCFNDLIELCKQFNIKPEITPNKSGLEPVIHRLKPELVFVCGWYWMIEPAILNLIPKGVLGIHNSLLPKYRGHAPLVWSMLDGEDSVGSSLFKIEEGMDTGDIYHQWRVERNNRYLTEVLKDIDDKIGANFGSILLGVLTGKILGEAQDNRLATFSSKRREEDGYIDWNENNQKVLIKIKALSEPYPNAFTFVGQKKILIIKAELFEFEVAGIPGQISFLDDESAIICCGKKTGIKVLVASDTAGNKELKSLFSRLSSPKYVFE